MTLYRLSNIQQRYGMRTVLDIPALSIEPGEILGLLGPSGAGKSTLLSLLGLLEPPSVGSVMLHMNGRDITYESATLTDRRALAMVFQRPILLSRSVKANLAYALNLRRVRNTAARVNAMLTRICMSELAGAHPSTLSGGEAQRVAIARALILEPRILLLDEPTANLDPANVDLIEGLIREQHDQFGATIILITHNLFQARRLATRTGLLIGGELVEIAPTETFFNDPVHPQTRAFLSGRMVY